MVSRGEDDLLNTITWSDDSYILSEFLTEFPLPQVVKIVRGHDGTMTNSPTLGFGEVLTLHALRESRTLVGEDKNENEFAVALNYPDDFQVLPQTSDCKLDSCGVTDLASFYQTVKYLEVIQAHYGTDEDLNSSAQGELLEILDIVKPQKPDKAKVHVLNLHSEQKSTLTYTCSARFRPLLDWKKYKANELKTHQYGFPIRVKFAENADWIREDMECQRIISKTPVINITDETQDITIISTTVASDPELKFCYEIPKNLEIKVAVAEGFANGAKHYTDVVDDLNQRFDVAKFMTSFEPTMIRRRNAIRQYNYDTIRKCIVKKFRHSVLVEQATDAPALPPRRQVPRTVSMPPTPPKPTPTAPLRSNSESHVEHDAIDSPPGGEDDASATLSEATLQSTEDDVNNPKGPGVRRVKPPINTPITPKAHASNPDDPPKPKAKEAKQPVKPPINTPNSLPVVPPATTNDHADSKSNKPPVELRKPAPDSVSTIKNKPISPLVAELKSRVKIPVRPPRSLPPGKKSKPEEAETNEPPPKAVTTNKPLDKALDETDAPVVEAKQTITKSSPSAPQTDVQANLQNNEPAVAAPKLPPRDGRPKLHETPNNDQGGSMAEEARTTSQNEENHHQPGTDYIPNLPLKSPKWPEKYPIENPNYVIPIQPNVSSNYPQSPSVPPAVPSSPRPGNKWGKKRSDTLPREFKFGQNNEYAVPQTGNEDSVYEEPFQRPVAMPTVHEKNSPTTAKFPGHDENPYDLVARIPLDLSGLSIGQVSDLLKNLNMAEYAETFENEMIDGCLLKEMKESQLTDLQMTSFHRTKLLNFINGWRPKLAADKRKT